MSSASNVHPLPRNTVKEVRPTPPLPPDVDLTSFHYLPLTPAHIESSPDWRRARRDPFHAFRFFTLIMATIKQTPSGSLPNDDESLADIMGVDDAAWLAMKDDVLRGWVLCSDDRWHHPIAARMTAEAWEKHRGNKKRTDGANAANAAKRDAARDEPRDVGRDVPRDAGKGMEGRGEDKIEDEDNDACGASPDMRLRRKAGQFFDLHVWPAYPPSDKHHSSQAARRKFVELVMAGADPEEVRSGVLRYADAQRDPRYVKSPLAFLADQDWNEGEPLEDRRWDANEENVLWLPLGEPISEDYDPSPERRKMVDMLFDAFHNADGTPRKKPVFPPSFGKPPVGHLLAAA